MGVLSRGWMVVGVLGLALSAAAHAQQYRPWGTEAELLGFEDAGPLPADHGIVLANCVAVFDPEGPPKKTPGPVIIVPEGAPKKKAEKTSVRPTPMPMEPVVETVEGPEPGDDCGCADCAGCCAGHVSCCCRPRDRFYVALSGGGAHRETVREVGDPSTFIIFNEGFAANVALGWRFCDMFRAEAEYTFMNNDVETAGSAGLSSASAGNVNLRAWMFNVYHDLRICDCRWKPYVGAGIGFYQSELNSLYPDFFDVAGPPMAGVGLNATSDITFAYQFRAGVSYELSCRAEVYSGYRFFHGDELTFSAPPFSAFAPTFHPDGAEMHCLEMGLRIGF